MTVSSVAVSQELSAFLEELEEAATNIAFTMSSAIEDVEGIVLQAELLLRDVTIIEEILEPEEGNLLFPAIGSLLESVRELADSYRCSKSRGRQRIQVTEEQIATLLELHFSNRDIAGLLGVSARTIRRRIIEDGLEQDAEYSELQDGELDDFTKQFVDTHPNSGQRSLA